MAARWTRAARSRSCTRPSSTTPEDAGGNLFVEDTLTSFGSVVALPHGSVNCLGEFTVTSTGYNTDDDGTCSFGAGPGDRSDFATPLQLGALAANGGLAPTRLPATGSPLIDQIPVAECGGGGSIKDDERGIIRPQGPACDVGAVEVQVATPPTTVGPTTTTTTTAARAVTVTPKFTG